MFWLQEDVSTCLELITDLLLSVLQICFLHSYIASVSPNRCAVGLM